MTPEENTNNYFRNRSLALQATLELAQKSINEVNNLLLRTMEAVEKLDGNFKVDNANPLDKLLDNLRKSNPELKEVDNNTLLKMVADNPSAFNK